MGLLVIWALLVDLIVSIIKLFIVDVFSRILLVAMVCNAVTIDKGRVNLNWTTTHLNCHLVAIVIVMIAIVSLGRILLRVTVPVTASRYGLQRQTITKTLASVVPTFSSLGALIVVVFI